MTMTRTSDTPDMPAALTADEPQPTRFGRGVWRRSTLLRHATWSVLGLLGYLVVVSLVDTYRDVQLAQIAYTAIAVAGLTVLSGLSGQISLGHGAFMAIGAYALALLLQDQGWPLGVVLVVSTVISAVAGVIVGLAAARLRGPYLAGATLALAVGLPALANYHRLRDTLGGENGIIVLPSDPPAGLNVALEQWQACICGLCLVVTLFVLANTARSRLGRDMRLIREDEVAAALCGVRIARTQVFAFTLSAGCAGLGGALLAMVNSLAAPGAFPLTLSLSLITAAVLGGLGSLAGAIYGSVLVTLLPTWSNDIAQAAGLGQSFYANLPLVLYGLALIGVVLFFPTGINGALSRLTNLLRHRIRTRGS
jgi:branched-chain amino acid transport system permease protein